MTKVECRVMAYGARAPEGDVVDQIVDQMRLARRYRNDLIEVELRRRGQRDACLLKFCGDVAAITAEVERLNAVVGELQSGISGRNAAARQRVQSQEEKARLRAAREALREARTRLRAAKAAARKGDAAEQLAAIDRAAWDEAKRLRSLCGVYWGTYLTVEADVQRARMEQQPQFRSFRGEGKVAIQIQGGLGVAGLLACQDRRLRLELSPKVGRRGRRFGSLWFRIGSSGPKKDPVWAIVPIVYHRPLPDDAVVTWAALIRRRLGTHFRWEVQFTVDRPVGTWKSSRAEGGVVGVDLNWRLFDNGLRVATWWGDGGESDYGHLFIPTEYLSRWSQTTKLQSARDQLFDQARDQLADWLAARGWENLPEWMRQWGGRQGYGRGREGSSEPSPDRPTRGLRDLRLWRSPGRLAALVLFWRQNRFPDDDIFPWLDGYRVDRDGKAAYDGWRAQDKHLYDWQESLMAKAIAWRDDEYRRFAATLASRFRRVVVEATNWQAIGKRPGQEATEAEVQAWSVARHYRRVAAPGRLREILGHAVSQMLKAPAKNTTQTCHVCGQLDAFEAAVELVRSCRHCGHACDQDLRAAANLRNYGAQLATPTADNTA